MPRHVLGRFFVKQPIGRMIYGQLPVSIIVYVEHLDWQLGDGIAYALNAPVHHGKRHGLRCIEILRTEQQRLKLQPCRASCLFLGLLLEAEKFCYFSHFSLSVFVTQSDVV